MSDTYPAPLDHAALTATWVEAWSIIGHAAPIGLLPQLLTAWAEPHRTCHGQQQLRECLALWVRWRDLSQRPGELAIALWFRAATYDPRSAQTGSNEVSSAAWAARSLARAGVDSDAAQRVYDLVMAAAPTAQHNGAGVPVASPDAQLYLDIDQSILGSPAERFARYDRELRTEFNWMPLARYRQARTLELQALLDRPRLYNGEPAATLFETQARINLSTALLQLQQ